MLPSPFQAVAADHCCASTATILRQALHYGDVNYRKPLAPVGDANGGTPQCERLSFISRASPTSTAALFPKLIEAKDNLRRADFPNPTD
jgi:hypothetical protein